MQNTKRQTDAARMVCEVVKELQQKKDSVEQASQNEEKQSAKKESESKPSFWGIWGMWIGIACAVVIVIGFLLWWCKI